MNYIKYQKKAVTSISCARSSIFNLSCTDMTKRQVEKVQYAYSLLLRAEKALRESTNPEFFEGETIQKTVQHIY